MSSNPGILSCVSGSPYSPNYICETCECNGYGEPEKCMIADCAMPDCPGEVHWSSEVCCDYTCGGVAEKCKCFNLFMERSLCDPGVVKLSNCKKICTASVR